MRFSLGGVYVGPEDRTDNEGAWVELLRMISNDRDSRPTLRSAQLLRQCAGGSDHVARLTAEETLAVRPAVLTSA